MVYEGVLCVTGKVIHPSHGVCGVLCERGKVIYPSDGVCWILYAKRKSTSSITWCMWDSMYKM